MARVIGVVAVIALRVRARVEVLRRWRLAGDRIGLELGRRVVRRTRARRLDDLAVVGHGRGLARDAMLVGGVAVPVLEQRADALVVVDEARIDTVGEAADLEPEI